MRKELPNKEAHLENLKKSTIELRQNVSSVNIQKEINGIDEFIEKENLTEDEKNEFLVIRDELQQILNQKK